MAPKNPILATLADARAIADRLVAPAADAAEAEIVDTLLRTVRTWGARELDSARTDADATIPRAIYEQAASLGLFGLTIPEEFGGAGLSIMASARIVEELATFDRSVATAIGLHNGLGLRGLIRFGSPELQARHLPDLATGSRIAAFAATEPGAGSHIAGVRTRGTWDGADSLSVSGEKCYVTNGGVADVFTILASTPGLGGARRGMSLLFLEKDTPGLAVGREEHKLGIRGSSTTTLTFDEVQLPVGNVIGEPGKGLDQIAEVLAWGRTLMSAGCLGTARIAFERTAAFVLTRVQFDKPIATFGQVREKIAQMRARLWAAECLVRLTTLSQVLGSDIVWESSITKVFTSEMAWRVTDDAVQLHGGAGYIEETGICRMLRDCRITRIFEGANEVLRFHVAASTLGFSKALESAPSLLGQVDPRLDDAARHLDTLIPALATTIDALRSRYGFRVGDHQLPLARLADATIAIYALLAVILRTEGELRGGVASGQAQAIRLAHYTSEMLWHDAEEALAASQRCADGDEALVNALAEHEYQLADGRA